MINLIRNHKIVTATLIIGLVGSFAGMAAINQPVESQVSEVMKIVEPTKDIEPVIEVEAVAPTVQVEEVATVATEVVVEPVVEPPKARTALEIAQQDYPHLFNYPDTDICFNKVITGMPQYFTPERLEQSMVLFGRLGSACSALGVRSLILSQNWAEADVDYSLIIGNFRNYYGDPQPR